MNQARTACFSIDVEDWFQVENLRGAIRRDQWDSCQLRVEANTERMLAMMAERGVTATMFILGWVAERCPSLVRRIAAAGHEIASHGYGHELVYRLTPEQFREDVRRTRHILQDMTGHAVHGYRAPNFSITDWAIDILQEEGYTYDSSSFPVVAHDRYGRLTGVNAGQCVSEIRPGFREVSVSCLNLGSRGVPWGGGAYFRLIPYWIFSRGVRHIQSGGQPYVFYIHPWEIDPDQPRVRGVKPTLALRHYINLSQGERRMKRLLADFRWQSIGQLLAS